VQNKVKHVVIRMTEEMQVSKYKACTRKHWLTL